ncbi:MAG: hypothetical protein QM783_17010 [Phycisphaerales bacterium]
MRYRTLLGVAGCLVAGLAVQTLVAWACFIYSDYTDGSGVVNNPLLSTGQVTATGFVVPADWKRQTLVEWWGVGKTRETVSECQWVSSRLMLTQSNERQATYNGFSAGWPCRSFRGCDYLTAGVQTSVPAPLVSVPAWIKAGGVQVPVEPRWTGLIANTLIFAAPVALAWSAVTAWSTSRRRRRGQCLHCGYCASGLPVCPECGRACIKGAA